MSSYKVLHEMPGLKIGDILHKTTTNEEGGQHCYKKKGWWAPLFSLCMVEDNPYWFEKIEENNWKIEAGDIYFLGKLVYVFLSDTTYVADSRYNLEDSDIYSLYLGNVENRIPHYLYSQNIKLALTQHTLAYRKGFKDRFGWDDKVEPKKKLKKYKINSIRNSGDKYPQLLYNSYIELEEIDE